VNCDSWEGAKRGSLIRLASPETGLKTTSVCIAEGDQMGRAERPFFHFRFSVTIRRACGRCIFLEKRMSSTSDLIQHTETVAQPTVNVFSERVLPALAAVALGAVLIYGAGFASKIELHNAAHDGRHSAGFPCH